MIKKHCSASLLCTCLLLSAQSALNKCVLCITWIFFLVPVLDHRWASLACDLFDRIKHKRVLMISNKNILIWSWYISCFVKIWSINDVVMFDLTLFWLLHCRMGNKWEIDHIDIGSQECWTTPANLENLLRDSWGGSTQRSPERTVKRFWGILLFAPSVLVSSWDW